MSFNAPGWSVGRVDLRPDTHPLVMGILNLTPDSFHAPSRVPAVENALTSARVMIKAGADILDLGAESSRPGAAMIGPAEEQDRLLPLLVALRSETDIPLSIDTIRATTARLALSNGADAINDISAGRHDPDMFSAVAGAGCGMILMHMQGTPRTMQQEPHYKDVVGEVRDHLDARFTAAVAAGINPSRLILDPGIGFGKTLAHNLSLLGNLRNIASDHPLLLGASRKRFIGEITGAPTDQRLPGSLATLALAHAAGTTLVRVHDVAASVQFLKVLAAAAGQD